jgi:hypothetical protein
MKRPDIQSEVYNCELNCISKLFDLLVESSEIRDIDSLKSVPFDFRNLQTF